MKTEFIKNNEIIETIDDWRRHASPKGKDKHWVVGRSAYSMADFAIYHNEKFKEVVSRILKECELHEQDFKCEPEATAGLGRGMKRGGPRNHDLLMIGKNCVIGIEAKVSETFDANWGDVQKEQREKQGNDNIRALALKEFLTPDKNVDDIGYQLFTATRGTMISAMKAGYKNAILLIIIFEGDIVLNNGETRDEYEKTIEKNDNDFEKFLRAINSENGKIQREIEGKTINCWIKKVKIRISDYTIAE